MWRRQSKESGGNGVGVANAGANSVEKPKGIHINGLRMYIRAATPESVTGDEVFYSRREDGPYYRWSFKEALGQWHCSRMHTSELSSRELSVARWKGVPLALQTSLVEHYLE